MALEPDWIKAKVSGASCCQWIRHFPDEELDPEPDDDDDLEVEEERLGLLLVRVVLDRGEHAQTKAQEHHDEAATRVGTCGTPC